MNLNKQFVNLIGIVLVAAILVAGVALVAMPMFAQAQRTDASTASVAQTNSVYETQVAVLSTAEDRIDDIDAHVAELREQLAPIPQLDDVHEIVAAAAQSVGVRIESVTADEVASWIARDALDGEGNAVAKAAQAPAAETAEPAEGESAAAAPPATTSTTETAQQQVLVTIVIDVTRPFALATEETDAVSADPEAEEPDAAALLAQAQRATDFVDALGRGPRLILPINVAYVGGKLTVTVLTFIREED